MSKKKSGENKSDEKWSITDNLYSGRSVILSGEINHENTMGAIRALLRLQIESSEKPINLVINSGGGSVTAAYHMCDVMDHFITAPIRGIGLGMCGSAATDIMMACTERLSTKGCRFLIHSGGFEGIRLTTESGRRSEDVKRLVAEMEASEEDSIKRYMHGLKKTRDEVKALIARGDHEFNSFMSAQEALEVGLIERILNPGEKIDLFTNK